ncbi:hypothetical protein OJ252_3610 [Cryptosporidium canis]|uniref:Transcription factor 25 n=1 Tax=Cryptosporidium canis TaxID=195482 RepID=A0ABQ8P2Z8_9CRYT|nr:hypothetical protein OJ252_3610 [Cryptosporidium canis]
MLDSQKNVSQKSQESPKRRTKTNRNRIKESKKLINQLSKRHIPSEETQCCLIMKKKHFDCENEIFSIFGNEAIGISKRTDSRKHTQKNSYLNMRHYFVSSKPQWPHLYREESGIIMKYFEERNEFSISFDIEYIKKKELLDALVDSMLLDEIYLFMERNPFFFSGLLKLADISILRNEHEIAFEYLQKALYVFESSLHPSFSPFKYKNGLPITNIKSGDIESRDIFILLGSYMNSLGNRGLFRTAFEYCLLLISMDITHDRFHSLLHLDYYAILSSEFDTLFEINSKFLSQFGRYCTWDENKIRQFRDTFETTKRLDDSTPLYYILPNFAFGIPLAFFIQYISSFSSDKEQLDEFNRQIKDITIDQIISTKFDTNEIKECSIYLIQSLIVFPEFVTLLYENLETSHFTNSSDQSKIISTFTDLLDSPTDSIQTNNTENKTYPYLLVGRLLVEANLEKCIQIWKKPMHLNWLNACCDKVCDIVNNNIENRDVMKSFISKRRNILMDCKFNVFRYIDVRKSEFSKNPTIPSFFRDEYPERRINSPSNNLAISGYSYLNSDPISLYFISLLPWYNVDIHGNEYLSINLKEIVVDCMNALKNYLNSYL